jgi:hypothetical protein
MRELLVQILNALNFLKPLFVPKYNIPLNEERQLAYDRLKKICDTGLFSVKDFWSNPRNIFAAHEITGMVCPSTTTKLTVQFNLFGGTLLKVIKTSIDPTPEPYRCAGLKLANKNYQTAPNPKRPYS